MINNYGWLPNQMEHEPMAGWGQYVPSHGYGSIQGGAVPDLTVKPTINKPGPLKPVQIPQRKQLNIDSSKGVGIVSSLVNFIGSGTTAFGSTNNVDQLLKNNGSYFANNGEWGYQKQNDIDASKEMAEVSKQNTTNTLGAAASGAGLGAAVGSIVPGAGTLIGSAIGGVAGALLGLGGSAKRRAQARKRVFDAQQAVIRTNNYNQSSAQSDYLQRQYLQENGDSSSQLLYGAKNGKDKGMRLSGLTQNRNVWSSIGKLNSQPNARVSGGESIFEGDSVDNATGAFVNQGKPNADNQLANLKDSSVVFGDNVNLRTGVKYKDEVAPYVQALEKINKKYETRTNNKLNLLRGSMGETTDQVNQAQINKLKKPIVDFLNKKADEQKEDRAVMNQFAQYKNGKDAYPAYAAGKNTRPTILDTTVPMGTGALLSLGQYFGAKNQRPASTDVYSTNPYEAGALNDLSSLHINPYYITRANADAERRLAYQIANQGGMTSGQRAADRIALGLGAMTNNADALQKAELQNLQFRQAAAAARLQQGNTNAQRRTASNQQDYENYAAVHAARQQGMQMGLRNFMDYLNNYTSNEYKRKQGNNMLDLYQQQIDEEKAKNLRDYNQAMYNRRTQQVQAAMPDMKLDMETQNQLRLNELARMYPYLTRNSWRNMPWIPQDMFKVKTRLV